MYKIKVEARMDFLGEVLERFDVEINEYTTKEEAKRQAEIVAHKENCQKYRTPVHFKAIKCSNWR